MGVHPETLDYLWKRFASKAGLTARDKLYLLWFVNWLCEGTKSDDLIALRWGVSRRTFRARVRNMMYKIAHLFEEVRSFLNLFLTSNLFLYHTTRILYIFKVNPDDRFWTPYPKKGPFRGVTFVIDSMAFRIATPRDFEAARKLYDYKLNTTGLRYDSTHWLPIICWNC